jgi:hypothetical protein
MAGRAMTLDRADVVATAILRILVDAERELDLDPGELKLQLEMYLRKEFADLTQEIMSADEADDDDG